MVILSPPQFLNPKHMGNDFGGGLHDYQIYAYSLFPQIWILAKKKIVKDLIHVHFFSLYHQRTMCGTMQFLPPKFKFFEEL